MPSLKTKLLDIRDLLRTGLAPDALGYTEYEWAQHKIDRASGHLTAIIEDLQAKEARRKLSSEEKLKLRLAERRRQLRDHWRGRLPCAGCHNNRYNYETAGDGWNAPTTGEGCWWLKDINRRTATCSMKRNG